MSPRTFLLLALALLTSSAYAQPQKRPNILFFFSDDHAYQAISAYGFGLNRTPNLDRIAQEGMRFDRCLTTYSLCGPSRACLLTGKYAHLNGFWNNGGIKFDGSQQTFPKLMQKAGYQTPTVGKGPLESDPTGSDYWEILPGQGKYSTPPMIKMGQRIKKEGYTSEIISADA